MKLRITLLLIATLILSGCVVTPYYENDYVRYNQPSLRYYEPCCKPSTVIIRQNHYRRSPPVYYRPHHNNYHLRNGYNKPYNNHNYHRPHHGYGPRR